MLHPEEWLKKHCLPDDKYKFAENDDLPDALWTNNVIKYLAEYAEYIVQQRLSAEPSDIKTSDNRKRCLQFQREGA